MCRLAARAMQVRKICPFSCHPRLSQPHLLCLPLLLPTGYSGNITASRAPNHFYDGDCRQDCQPRQVEHSDSSAIAASLVGSEGDTRQVQCDANYSVAHQSGVSGGSWLCTQGQFVGPRCRCDTCVTACSRYCVTAQHHGCLLAERTAP